jgi:predicted ATPase
MTLSGSMVVASLYGRSGIGKSTLLRRFLREVQESHPRAIVLAGSCHQNETVPFKALDEVIVTLTRLLRRMSGTEMEILLPRDADFAARMFPVLRQIHAVANTPSDERVTDSVEFRRRAFQSIIELFGRLGMRHDLIVIAIDDLQWGDDDSAALLRELLTTSTPPRLPLIASYRGEDQESSEFLRCSVSRCAMRVRLFRPPISHLAS